MHAKKNLFNPLDPDFRTNPYPTYDRLRQEDPVHKNIFGNWIVTRYSDAQVILNDKRFVVDNLPERLQQKSHYLKEGNLNTLIQTIDKWLVFLEPPNHTRLKATISPAFSQAIIENMRPEIQAIFDDLFSKVVHKGEIDIIADLAIPLPALAITKIFGLPIEDYEKLIRWSADSIFIFEQPIPLERYQAQNKLIIEHKQYFLEKVAEYRKIPNNGLISYLANQQDVEQPLTAEEIASICIMLNITAQETTQGLLGNGFLALLKHPDALENLRQNPDKIKSAVEELLRYDSPIQFVARRAKEDVEISGRLIRSQENVIIYIGAVNRDPEQFPLPNQLDFNRHSHSMAFGRGIHYCIGVFLAKLEAQILISTLLNRLYNIQLNTDKLEWYESTILRRLKALPIKFSTLAEQY